MLIGERTGVRTAQNKTNNSKPYFEKEFTKAKYQGVIPKDCKNLVGSWSGLTNAGEATGLNLVHMRGYNPLKVKDLTSASIEGRRKTIHTLITLKKFFPGF